MRSKLLLPLILLTTLSSFSQSPDTYQGDSIYRVNKIKTRTMFFNWDKAYWRAVDHFDHNGQLTEHARYDSTGLKCVEKEIFRHDSIKHHLISQVEYLYGQYDTIARKITWKDVPDTLYASFEYDSDNRVTHKTFRNAFGKLTSDFNFSYNPFIVKQTFWYADSSRIEKTIYIDKHFRETSSVAVNHFPNGDSAIINFTIKNIYNKSGWLTKRKIRSDSESDAPLFIDEQDYMYMSSGLLVRKTSYLKNKPGYIIVELYDYKFW